MQDERPDPTVTRDEARITLEYLYRFKHRASILIEDNISRAIGGHRWDDGHLWHGVKSRVLSVLEVDQRVRK